MNCNEISRNISLTQLSIAHILNEAGDNLHKAVDVSDNICDLLDANDATICTIQYVTTLQKSLYQQLQQIFEHTCDHCCTPNTSTDYYYCAKCNCYHPY